MIAKLRAICEQIVQPNFGVARNHRPTYFLRRDRSHVNLSPLGPIHFDERRPWCDFVVTTESVASNLRIHVIQPRPAPDSRILTVCSNHPSASYWLAFHQNAVRSNSG